MPRFALGLDIGTSAVKATLLDSESGRVVASAQSPNGAEIPLSSPHEGWAEQDPLDWWTHTVLAVKALGDLSEVGAIGIAYQMHGLVLLDSRGEATRPSIIWCDGRAVASGEALLAELGEAYCAAHLLNAPGNFTAAKIRWCHDQGELGQATTAFLPGDYINFRLTGERNTSPSGLSEMTLWSFADHGVARDAATKTGGGHLLPKTVETFEERGRVHGAAACELGITEGTPVTYVAGDQPNNAFSLGVMNDGEVAATAGTSGVVYGVSNTVLPGVPLAVGRFLHVNETIGTLMCLNGAGAAYAWLRRTLFPHLSFAELNELAQQAPPDAGGLQFACFGNGPERILNLANPGAGFTGLDFRRHGAPEVVRAVLNGIVDGFALGVRAMTDLGCTTQVIKAGRANLFLSDLFAQMFADKLNAEVQLYSTDGSQGAARGAALGAGWVTEESAFAGLQQEAIFRPQK